MMPFKQGQSGNPNGRPKKGKSLTEALEKAMKKKREDGRTNYNALADTLIDLAIKDKNIAAIKYIMDRVDGRPTETVKLDAEAAALEGKLAAILGGGTAP